MFHLKYVYRQVLPRILYEYLADLHHLDFSVVSILISGRERAWLQ